MTANRCGWCLEFNAETARQCRLCGRPLLSPPLQALYSLESRAGVEWTQGADISSWQETPEIPGEIDFERMRGAGARFVIHRRLHGTYPDDDYPKNWPKIHSAGMFRGAYDYLTWERTGRQQAELFLEKLGGDFGDVPPVADYECRTGLPPSTGYMRQQLVDWLFTVSQAIERAGWVFRLESQFGRKPMIYTSPYYWLEFGSTDQYWLQYPLWIANYYVSAPYVPAPWKTWTLWQYTDKGDGLAYGVESKQIDLDWYNGGLPEYVSEPELPTEPPTPPPGGIMTTYRTLQAVNQRTEHSTAGGQMTVIQLLPTGAVMTCDDVWIGVNQVWAHVKAPDGRWGWVAVVYAGVWYLRSV